MSSLVPFVGKETVAERLPLVFPEGIENRTYCVRDLAASTVFAAIYIGAVEDAGRYFGPVHVYRMTAEQALKPELSDREAYNAAIIAKRPVEGERWYADNTREPIRDETLRDGLVAVGAVMSRADIPTTSGAPRYSLKADFAALFDPELVGSELEQAIGAFQAKHLNKSAQARLAIVQAGAAASRSGVLVRFPNGETRQLAPGPSSVISRAVVEEFAPLYLEDPAVLWLSESGNKVAFRDEQLAKKIGLRIEADKNLPDLILADLGPEDPLIVFVEVVATDGAVTSRRRDAFFTLTDGAGFDRRQVAMVTAYQDRQSAGFKKTVPQLSWGSYAWFASEPTHLLTLHASLETKKLSKLLG